MASPFLNRIINFIHRHVPSFVPDGKDSSAGGDGSQGGGESVASGQQPQMKPDQDVDLHSNSGEHIAEADSTTSQMSPLLGWIDSSQASDRGR